MIEDLSLLLLGKVLVAHELNQVAGIRSVQSIEEKIQTVMKIRPLAIGEVRTGRPRRKVVKDIEQIGKERDD